MLLNCLYLGKIRLAIVQFNDNMLKTSVMFNPLGFPPTSFENIEVHTKVDALKILMNLTPIRASKDSANLLITLKIACESLISKLGYTKTNTNSRQIIIATILSDYFEQFVS